MSTEGDVDEVTTSERILEVAAELILRQGYAATPLSAIAAEVGVTKAALYYHYPSKEQILSSLVEPLLNRVDELLADTPQHFTDADSRWQFILEYAGILRSFPRSVAILGADNTMWLTSAVRDKIAHHRERTMELARFADVSDEEQVRGMLAMDLIHRELVLTSDRVHLADVSPQRRQELVLSLVREFLDAKVA